MTFKDTNVIMGDDINDQEDVLEDVELQSAFRQRLKNKVKAPPAQYDGLNGDSKKSVLSKYDDEDEEISKKKNDRIILRGNGGVVQQAEEGTLESIRDKLSLKSKTKVSLDVSKVNT